MVSRVKHASREVTDALQKGDTKETVPAAKFVTNSSTNAKQAIAITGNVDGTSSSSLNNPPVAVQAPSTPKRDQQHLLANSSNHLKVGFVSPGQSQSPLRLHDSVISSSSSNNSVDSEIVLLESDEESEQEQVADRRMHDLLLRRSSSRRLGELLVADSSSSSDRPSSSGGNYSDDEVSTSYSSHANGHQNGKIQQVNGGMGRKSAEQQPTEDELYDMAQALFRSVIRLQALVRGYSQWRRYQRQKKAGRQIASWAKPRAQRMVCDRRVVTVPASICINAVIRGFLARGAHAKLVTYVETQLAALVIQKWWRWLHGIPTATTTTTSNSLAHHEAVQRIQAVYRGWATREFFALQRFAAALIQAQARGRQQRVAYRHKQLSLRQRVGGSTGSKAIAAMPALIPATKTVADGKAHPFIADMEEDDSSGRESASAKDDVSMPPLEDMEPPSESYGASSEPSDSSVDADSTQETVKTSNVHNAKHPAEVSNSKTDVLETTPLKEKASNSIKKSRAIASPPVVERLQAVTTTPQRKPSIAEEFDSMSRRRIEFNTPPPPPNKPLSSRPAPPAGLPPPRATNDMSKGKTLSYESPRTRELVVEQPLSKSSSDEILPPSPAKTEVDDDEDYDFSVEKKEGSNSAPSFFTLFLIITCFVLPIFFLFGKSTHLGQTPNQVSRSTGKSVKAVTSEAPTSESLRKMDASKQMESLTDKKMNMAMPMSVETKPVAMTMEDPPRTQSMSHTTPSSTVKSRWMKKNPPTDTPKRTSLPISTIFMPSADALHGIEIGERVKRDSPKRPPVPLPSIFMSSSDTIHGLQIGEREKTLSKSLSNAIHMPPFGQWANAIRHRFFETSTVLPTRLEVTGWLEIDGRGLFSDLLDPATTAVGLPKEPFIDEDSVKVAKDVHLSLVTEWGLTLKPLQKKN